MFKILLFVGLASFWLASDIEIGASVHGFEDNHFSLQFPQESLREKGTEPWVDFYWNASSSREEIVDMKDAVVN